MMAFAMAALLAALLACVPLMAGCSGASSSSQDASEDAASDDAGLANDGAAADADGADGSSADATDGSFEEFDPTSEFTFPIETLGTSEGLFVINADQTQAFQLWWKAGITAFNDFDDWSYKNADGTTCEGYLVNASDDPLRIDVTGGEQLAIVQGSDPRIQLYPVVDALGYGNPAVTEDLDGVPEIQGVDLSECANYDEANALLASQGLHFYWFDHAYYDYHALIADQPDLDITWGDYSGTSFIPYQATMYATYYRAVKDDYTVEPPIDRGKNGYFTLDLSGVDKGLYLLRLFGDEWYLVEIA